MYNINMIKNLECEFLVAGAGISGICAAIQAGRLGLDTVIIEKEMTLGGNAGPLLGVGPSGAHVNNEFYTETGIVLEIEEHLSKEGARPVQNLMALNTSVLWDRVVSDMLKTAGVRIFRKHLVTDAKTTNRNITKIEALNIENLDKIEFTINGFVMDATGDAHVAVLSGADTVMGRESKDQTQERNAPQNDDDKISAASLMAITAYTGIKNEFIPPKGTPKWNRAKPANTFDPKKKYNYIFQVDEGGESEELHPLLSPQELYESLVTRIYSIWDYFKNTLYKGKAEDHELIWISPILGRRESRRILGDYLLTQTDIEENKDFSDAAGFGGFYLDYHPHSNDGGYETYFYSNPLPYQIPLRCLYSRNIINLFSAGRAISASHIAFTSTRVMRTGGLLGQSAAVCAKMCCEKNSSPSNIAANHIKEFHTELRKNDVFIPGIYISDNYNLTEGSIITASSEDNLDMEAARGDIKFTSSSSETRILCFPENLEKLMIYVRNRKNSAKNLDISISYGVTDPIELHNPDLSKTGRNYNFHYPLKEETVSKFHNLKTKTLSVPAHYEGWASIDINMHKFNGPDRKTVRKCLRILTSGNVDIGITPIKPDYIEGKNVPLLKFEPLLKPGAVTNITDGFIHREGVGLTHQWTSRYGEPLPQSLTIDFRKQISFSEIHLVFDTTEKKEHDMFYVKGEKAPARCAKNYKLEAIINGKPKTIYSENDNCFRFKKIVLDKTITADKLVLTINANVSGKGPARVYDIRVYN